MLDVVKEFIKIKYKKDNFNYEDIDRKFIVNVVKGINIKYSKVVKNTYTKLVIVATNVAEASLTFDNLKYVIDSGFVNSNTYIEDNLVNKIVSIREDNRI